MIDLILIVIMWIGLPLHWVLKNLGIVVDRGIFSLTTVVWCGIVTLLTIISLTTYLIIG